MASQSDLQVPLTVSASKPAAEETLAPCQRVRCAGKKIQRFCKSVRWISKCIAAGRRFEKELLPVQLNTGALLSTLHPSLLSKAQPLEVRHPDAQSSEILIPRSFVDETGRFLESAGLAPAIEKTLEAALRASPYWDGIEADRIERPRFFLHGCQALDMSSEVWTTQARTLSWATLYTLAHRVHDRKRKPAQLELSEEEEVLGRVFLLTVDEDAYDQGLHLYDLDGGSTGVMECINCKVEGLAPNAIVARRGYETTRWFGRFNQEEPDAFVFRGDALAASGLRVLHEFRVLAPLRFTERLDK